MTDTKSYPRLVQCDPRSCISSKVLRINRLTAAIFRKHLHPFSVTDSQLTVLFVLSKMGGLSQQLLSDMACLDKSTMSRNLRRLFERGLIEKGADSSLSITKEGKKLVNGIIPSWENAMSEVRAILQEDGEAALDLVLQRFLTTNNSEQHTI